MISMTWPQYLRRECTVIASLSPQESEVLSALLVRHPTPVPTADLIEALWPDPDTEREFSTTGIHMLICALRKKLGAGRIDHDGTGYRLRQDFTKGALHV